MSEAPRVVAGAPWPPVGRADPEQSIRGIVRWTAGVALLLAGAAAWTGVHPAPLVWLPWFIPSREMVSLVTGLGIAAAASGRHRATGGAYPLLIGVGFAAASALSAAALLASPASPADTAISGQLAGYYVLSIQVALGTGLLLAATWGEARRLPLRAARWWAPAAVALTAAYALALQYWEAALPALLAPDRSYTGTLRLAGLGVTALHAGAAACHWRLFRRTGDATVGYVALGASVGLVWTLSLVTPARLLTPFWYVTQSVPVLVYLIVLLGFVAGSAKREPVVVRSEALRESDERFRLLFASTPEPTWVYDADTLRVLEVNDAAAHAYGYSREEFLAMTIRDLAPAEDRERHRLKDGRLIDVQITSRTLELAGRRAVLVAALDVTARRRAEQDLRAITEELERRLEQRTAEIEAANRDLETFSYSVSHDLRAPLRAIDGFGRALLQDYRDQLDDQGRDYLTRMCNASQRMAGLIDDLLALSRVGRAEMRRTPVDLGELARGILEEFRQREPDRRVEAVVADGLTATGDSRLLRVLLEHLIGNAWKFTGRREQARIEVGAVARNGGRVFFVRDNGAGFDMAYAGKLFAPFQRLHSPAQFEGNGIGLATVRRIVRRHDGEVWAEGAVEQGATLYFTL